MRMQFSLLIALFLFVFQIPNALAKTEIQTSVSNNQVFLGDLFQLTIQLNDSGSEYKLDTRPLEQDFTVYRPSENRSTQIINGEYTTETLWKIRLQAKRTGELVIPALSIGSLHSKAITISVQKPSEKATNESGNAVFMENSINKDSIYIGQPIILTTKIYLSQSSNELELNAPQLAGATIEVYGQDKSSETIRNGMRYKVITRQFQIQPSNTGSFTISSPLLTGNLRQLQKISEWQNRIKAVPINVRGDSLKVQIKAQPQNYQGKWLISEDVRLIENNKLTENTYQVGEPITRSITLQVASISKDKLPNIDINYPKNWRYYRDQDQIEEGEANGLMYSQRTISHAIIANEVGELILPEIKLPWWNSITDKQEFATLPEQRLAIIAADNAQQEPALISTPAVNQPPTELTVENVIIDDSKIIYWQVITLLLLLLLIAMIVYHLHYRRCVNNSKNTLKTQQKMTNDSPYSRLQSALKENDTQRSYQALLHYWQQEYPQLKSLNQLVKLIDWSTQDTQQLQIELKKLEKVCVDKNEKWDASSLASLLEKHTQKKKQKSHLNKSNLMNLNDSHY